MISQCGYINCNEYTIFIWNIDQWKDIHVWVQEVCRKALYLMLSISFKLNCSTNKVYFEKNYSIHFKYHWGKILVLRIMTVINSNFPSLEFTTNTLFRSLNNKVINWIHWITIIIFFCKNYSFVRVIGLERQRKISHQWFIFQHPQQLGTKPGAWNSIWVSPWEEFNYLSTC